MNLQDTTLAQYIAEYIDYELTECGRNISDINEAMIESAIEAYNGGAR
jgi:hypothetical protein